MHCKCMGMVVDVPYEGYMYTHVTVYGGTVEAYVHPKGDTGPCWVSGLTVDTRLNTPKAKCRWRMSVRDGQFAQQSGVRNGRQGALIRRAGYRGW